MAVGDRRPVAARGWAPIRAASDALIRRGASADAISLAGLVAGCVAGTLFGLAGLAGDWAPWLWLGGAVLVPLRLLANVLDGMVAVGRGTASPLGELYNEIPDRLSDTAVLAGVGYGVGAPALGWAAAVAAMLTAYVRAVGKAAGASSEFCGPMAKQQRMVLVVLLAVFCAVMPLPWRGPAGVAVLWVVLAGSGVTSVRRLARVARTLRRSRGG